MQRLEQRLLGALQALQRPRIPLQESVQNMQRAEHKLLKLLQAVHNMRHRLQRLQQRMQRPEQTILVQTLRHRRN